VACLLAANRGSSLMGAMDQWPFSALRYHWLTPISCYLYLRDCKAHLATSLSYGKNRYSKYQSLH